MTSAMKNARWQGPDAGRDERVPRYSLPSLEYEYRALEPLLSGEIVELHHAVHHAAYVKGANKAADDLVEARSGRHFDTIAKLERDLVFNFSGHVLHSLLWKNLSPQGGGRPEGELADAIYRQFGSFDALRAQMNAVCLTLQGSGWGALCWDPLGRQLLIEQVLDHHNNIGRCTLPILVIDMWEHAYYLQFKSRKEAWLEAYWQLIDWQDVARRFATVRQTGIAL
jgi:Fe-Mn family superoxide dismutase